MLKHLVMFAFLTVSVWAQPSVGRLSYDLPEARVLAIMGEPAKRSAEVYEAATGLTLTDWEYPKEGLELTMAQSERDGSTRLYRLSLEAPGLRDFGAGGIGATREVILEWLRKRYPEGEI